MIISINFANKPYEVQRRYNTSTAYKYGKIDQVIEYSPKDIDEQFLSENAKILSCKRGAGLWLWKPYFILKTLEGIKDGDYLFYCDSGSFYVNTVNYLISAMNSVNQSVLGFELPLIMRQFTKKETFKIMSSNAYDENQNLATFILFKKDDFSLKFVKEWLSFCCDERALSAEYFLSDVQEFDDFISHREDQSIFSILYKKYALISFRDPSQFGLRPFEYLWTNGYEGVWKRWIYRPLIYNNSPYPKILVLNRANPPKMFKRKEQIKDFLWRVGLYNEKVFRCKNVKD